MMYILYIETDWDFHVEFKGESLYDQDVSLAITDFSELEEVKAVGNKTWEFDQALEAIKKNPTQGYSSLGGNRGVLWKQLV